MYLAHHEPKRVKIAVIIRKPGLHAHHMARTFTAWFGQASQTLPDSCSGKNGSSIQHTVGADNAFQDTTNDVLGRCPDGLCVYHILQIRCLLTGS